MAFYNEDEDEIGQEGEGVNLGGQSGSLSAGVSGAQAASSPGQPDNPGNFVGLKTYLDANKNQANKFGEKVSNNISGKINEANQGIQNFGSQFENEARSGLIQGFDTAKNEANQITNKAATGALNALPNEQERNRFGQIVNAQYSGPKSAQESNSFNPVRQSVMEAQKLSDQTKTEEGVQDLVKGQSNQNKNYTPGANRLDSYLMNTEENKQRLANARQGAESLQPGFAALEPAAAQVAGKFQADTEALKSDARKLLENTSLSKKASVQSELQKQQAAAQARNAQIAQLRNALVDESDGEDLSLTQDQLNALGLSAGTKLFGSLNKNPTYYLPNEEVFDANKAISKDEQARLSALAGLSGTYGGAFTNPYSQADLAGTYKPSNFDTKAIGGKIKDEAAKLQKQYESQYKTDKLRESVGITNPSNPGITPDYLENVLLPAEKQSHSYMSGNTAYVKRLEKALSDWKNSRKYNNQVKKK